MRDHSNTLVVSRVTFQLPKLPSEASQARLAHIGRVQEASSDVTDTLKVESLELESPLNQEGKQVLQEPHIRPNVQNLAVKNGEQAQSDQLDSEIIPLLVHLGQRRDQRKIL